MAQIPPFTHQRSRIWELLIAFVTGGAISIATVVALSKTLTNWIIVWAGYSYRIDKSVIGQPDVFTTGGKNVEDATHKTFSKDQGCKERGYRPISGFCHLEVETPTLAHEPRFASSWTTVNKDQDPTHEFVRCLWVVSATTQQADLRVQTTAVCVPEGIVRPRLLD
jgi:hypothetical protein